MVFVARKIGNENEATLGSRLRALRRTQAVSLEKITQMTRIQKKYLEALEWGWYEDLPEPMYVRNFIRAYVRALSGPEQYFLSMYDEEVRAADLLQPHRLPRLRIRWARLFVPSKVLAYGGVALSVCLVGVYVIWQMSKLLAPPMLSLVAPVQDELSDRAQTVIIGHVTDRDAIVRINNVLAVVDEQGNFAQSVPLMFGVNEVIIEAKRRYSKPMTIRRVVVYTPKATLQDESL